MKCLDTTSDRKADAVVRVGGTECDEYGNHVASDGAICSWIAVGDGQKLTVETGFTGLTQEIHLDLVIDGVLRNCEKTIRKVEKKDRKSERFEHGFYAQSKVAIIEAEMEIKALDVSAYPSVEAEGMDSVGTIEVRISVLRDPNEERHKVDDVDTFETIFNWQDAHRTPSYTRICPVQQVDFIPIDQQPTKTLVTKLKQRATGDRPGSKPWVVFRFFYRTKEAIDNGGLKKSGPKNVVKFAAPAIKKNHVGSAAAVVTQALSTSTTTATEASFPRASRTTTASETAVHDDTLISDIANSEAPELPAADLTKDLSHTTASTNLDSLDLESEQPNIASEILPFSLVDEPDSSIIKSIEEHPLLIDEPSNMSTVEPGPLPTELQQAPDLITSADTTPRKPTRTGPEILESLINPAPLAKMAAEIDIGGGGEQPTPPATPKPVVKDQSLSDTLAEETIFAKKFSEIEETMVESITEAAETKTTETVINSVEIEADPVEPTTPKKNYKFIHEFMNGPNSLKRASSSSLNPDLKRLKLVNREMEKIIANKQKLLAKKRANRLEAQRKADDTVARHKEALEKLSREIDEEIAEEERLAKEAEPQFQASETEITTFVQQVSEDGEF